MSRTVVFSLVFIACMTMQAMLVNPTSYWFWVAGFFPAKHPHAIVNLGLCVSGIIGLLVVEVIIGGLIVRRCRRNVHSGVCHRCGYDLTGNVSGRCPECGQVAKRGSETTT